MCCFVSLLFGKMGGRVIRKINGLFHFINFSMSSNTCVKCFDRNLNVFKLMDVENETERNTIYIVWET